MLEGILEYSNLPILKTDPRSCKRRFPSCQFVAALQAKVGQNTFKIMSGGVTEVRVCVLHCLAQNSPQTAVADVIYPTALDSDFAQSHLYHQCFATRKHSPTSVSQTI
jgi:hypothetical protein